jgi:LacI family transcriptional regulator
MQRWSGVTTFTGSVDLEIDPRLVVDLPARQPNHEAAFALTEQLLRRKQAFTALMAFDDMSAFGAIRALGQAGVRVPEDCSVIGFDDVTTSAYYNPPLTTIRQNMELLGSTGAEVLLSALAASAKKEPWSPVHKTIEPHLVVRESTAPPLRPNRRSRKPRA